MNKKKYAIGIDFGGTNIRGGLVDVIDLKGGLGFKTAKIQF